MAGRARQQPPVCATNAPLVAALHRRARGQYSGQHMARTLTKAAGSICKYPLALTCAEQATQLEHIGPAVADLIGDILRELADAAAAAPLPAAPSSTSSTSDTSGGTAAALPQKRRRKDASQRQALADAFARDNATPSGDALAQLATDSQCDEAYIRRYFSEHRRKAAAAAAGGGPAANSATSGPSAAGAAGMAPQAASTSGPGPGGRRAYFPKERTGNWAVLIALAEHTTAPPCPDQPALAGISSGSGRTELLKSELIEFAQPLCDASFDPPPPGTGGGGGYSAVPAGGAGGGFHTAWSGVNKYLVGKGLVGTRSSPR
jgi:hypothetical protein